MAKFEEPYEDVQTLFTQLIQNAGLHHINIAIIVNNRAKKIFDVKKASDIVRFRTNDDVHIILNQKIFDKLNDQQKQIVAEDSLAAIHYDGEHDIITITKPDVVGFSGILSKYTFPIWNQVRESIKTLYHAEQQAEDEARAATEKAKAEKKKKKFA